MTEFWKSKDKYFCSYCKIYIADDKPSRSLHENGLRHKGAVDKFINDLYKKGAAEKKEKADNAREVQRIDEIARAAVLREGGKLSSAPTPPEPPKAARKPAAPAGDKWANYTTAEALGFLDPETELKQQRQNEGIAGKWEVVLPTRPIRASTSAAVEEEDFTYPVAANGETRPRREYFQERILTLNDEELYDPLEAAGGHIQLKRKRGDNGPSAPIKLEPRPGVDDKVVAGPRLALPKIQFGLKKGESAGEASTSTSAPATSQTEQDESPSEPPNVQTAPSAEQANKLEDVKPRSVAADPPVAPTSLFKKRKPGSGNMQKRIVT